ncbi:MarR family winged helix-turn-helix transcriptional regulator [Phytoactinopolyspora halotolerans]|uniref:MarR family transcriptional regulator n=1 Tax=Phytoactinopolyspora halotolerans TaxID=1981512 RepID=A0A6L9SAI8_9ACTN|nr:MarR family transcriptional regulator [Phytoactinopolyspora halotolerans]NEE01634.1 MarR family transcriptional regulator [Phytoactinopolyspora halotolerans]
MAPTNPRAIEAASLLETFRALHASHDALLEKVAQRYGIGRNDLRCLEILQRHGEMRPQQLAVLSGLSPAAITKVADRLIRAGFVTRSPSPTDRRGQVIGISDGHRELRAEIWDRIHADAVTVLASLGADDAGRLADVLERLIEVNRSHTRRVGSVEDGHT